ncbi:unnamed protein product, partial [marine sediment metagenome]
MVCKCDSKAKKPKYKVLLCASIHGNVGAALNCLQSRNNMTITMYINRYNARVIQKAVIHGHNKFVEWLLE